MGTIVDMGSINASAVLYESRCPYLCFYSALSSHQGYSRPFYLLISASTIPYLVDVFSTGLETTLRVRTFYFCASPHVLRIRRN